MALLILTTESVDGVHHQSALNRSERAHARIAALQLLHDQAVGHVIESCAAILFRQIGAEQPELCHLRNELFRKFSLYVAVADDGQDFFIDESVDGVTDGALFLREDAVDVVEVGHAGKLAYYLLDERTGNCN